MAVMLERQVAGATLLLLVACGGGPPPAGPSAQGGAADLDALGRAWLAATVAGDVAGLRALMPPPSLVGEVCAGYPEMVVAGLAGAEVDARAMPGVTVEHLATSIADDELATHVTIAPGEGWGNAAWHPDTCRVRRPVEYADVSVRYRIVEDGASDDLGDRLPAARIDGRWYLLGDFAYAFGDVDIVGAAMPVCREVMTHVLALRGDRAPRTDDQLELLCIGLSRADIACARAATTAAAVDDCLRTPARADCEASFAREGALRPDATGYDDPSTIAANVDLCLEIHSAAEVRCQLAAATLDEGTACSESFYDD